MSQSALAELQKTGRLPGVVLTITSSYNGSVYKFSSDPNDGSSRGVISYNFDSNLLVPVDAFNVSLIPSGGDKIFDDAIREGDLVQITIDNVPISTGIIDQTEVEVDTDGGERIMISGRDLLGQIEQQDAISADSKPFYAASVSFQQILSFIKRDVVGPQPELRARISRNQLFATEPGESKLAALQRACDAMNLLIWGGPDGHIIVGQPNFKQQPIGNLILNKNDPSRNNVLSMKATRESFTIPNFIVPIWASQGFVVDKMAAISGVYNRVGRPSELYNNGRKLPKCIVINNPEGADAQALADVNRLVSLGQNTLQAMAKREIARANMKELLVQTVIPGHTNQNGDPYLVDQVYNIQFDRGNVNKPMYLFHVSYSLQENGTRTSTLWFCNLNTIVGDAG